MSLDPRVDRLAREAQDAKDHASAPLDPPFPFRAIALDLDAFGLASDPPPPLTEPARQ
jgi:hypothetical protein